MARFKPGQSGNPNGRPKGANSKIPSNKAIKDAFKKYGTEAVENLSRYMRKYEFKASESAVKVEQLTKELEEAKLALVNIEKELKAEQDSNISLKQFRKILDEDVDYEWAKSEVKELESKLYRQEKIEETAIENMYKASSKLIDVADKVVVHIDKTDLEHKKHKIKESSEGSKEDEESEETPEPVVSLTAV